MEREWKILCIGILMGMLLLPVMVIHNNEANKTSYDFYKANAYLNKAQSTNKLQDIIVFFNQSKNAIVTHSGNVGWWYQTQDTDIGQVKILIESNIISVEKLLKANNSFAIQQAVYDIHTNAIPKIQERLDKITELMFWTPSFSVLFIYMAAVNWWFIPLVYAKTTLYLQQKEDERERESELEANEDEDEEDDD